MYDQAEAQCSTSDLMLKQAGALTGMGNRPTQRQQLEAQKRALAAHIEKIDKALEALDKNPGAEEVMNAIDRCRY